MTVLSGACLERCKRLDLFLSTLNNNSEDILLCNLAQKREEIISAIRQPELECVAVSQRTQFLDCLEQKAKQNGDDYINTLGQLGLAEKIKGSSWLQQLIDACLLQVSPYLHPQPETQ